MIKNLFLALLSVVLVILITEIISFTLYDKGPSSSCTDCFLHIQSKEFGRLNQANGVHTGSRICHDKKLCYRVTYKYDQYGRRIVGNEKVQERNLILFGGSVSKGEALPDQQTLQYLIQNNTPYRVFNYAVSGSGLSLALHFLKTGKIQAEVKSKKVDGFYLLSDFDKYRIVFDSSRSYIWGFPYYDLKNGMLIHKGSMVEAFPYKIAFARFLNFINKWSYFSKLNHLSFPKYTDEHLYSKLIAMLLETKREFESRFEGHFFVLVHTLDANDSLLKALKGAKLKFYHYENKRFYDPKISTVCSCDQHPNAKVTSFLADSFISELKSEKKAQVKHNSF